MEGNCIVGVEKHSTKKKSVDKPYKKVSTTSSLGNKKPFRKKK